MTDNEENGHDDTILDPDLLDELEKMPAESPFITEYTTGGRGRNDESLRFIEKWFPKEEDWQGKTNIQNHQAHALAVMRNIDKAFPEYKEIMPFIQGAIEDYEKYLTSIDGESRAQHVDILRTLFGGTEVDESESRSQLMQMFANRMDKDNE